MKILFLTTVLPRKKRMGSEVASQLIIDALVDLGNEVTVVGYVRPDDEYKLGSHEVCAGRRHIETKGAGLHSVLWLVSSFLRGLPYSVAKYRSSAFVALVKKLLREEKYDLLIVDHVQMSWVAQSIPVTDKLIGVTHNVEHQMYQSLAREQQGRLRRWVYERESRLLRKMEIDFAIKVDRLWTLTKSDAAFYAGVKENGDVKEIPLPASAVPSEAAAMKDFDIGLIGSWTWKANEEGLTWFFDSVYPNLPPSVAIRVAGSGAKWLEGRYRNVRYLGFVDDAQGFLRQARVVAIPALSGGGIQIKTLDAIASGSQIVATALALRGIEDPPPTVRVAETPNQCATQLCLAIGSSGVEASALRAVQWAQRRKSRFRDEVDHGVKGLAHPR